MKPAQRAFEPWTWVNWADGTIIILCHCAVLMMVSGWAMAVLPNLSGGPIFSFSTRGVNFMTKAEWHFNSWTWFWKERVLPTTKDEWQTYLLVMRLCCLWLTKSDLLYTGSKSRDYTYVQDFEARDAKEKKTPPWHSFSRQGTKRTNECFFL